MKKERHWLCRGVLETWICTLLGFFNGNCSQVAGLVGQQQHYGVARSVSQKERSHAVMKFDHRNGCTPCFLPFMPGNPKPTTYARGLDINVNVCKCSVSCILFFLPCAFHHHDHERSLGITFLHDDMELCLAHVRTIQRVSALCQFSIFFMTGLQECLLGFQNVKCGICGLSSISILG